MKREDLKGEQSPGGQTVSGKTSHEGPDSSRRRLLKGIVGAAPVVMAVSSKPALANFCTVSGFLSGNLSNPNSQTFCGGGSPGYWVNHVTAELQGTTFLGVFGGVWRGDAGAWSVDPADTPSLYEVLKMGGGEDRFQFGAHAVAAYQNALLVTGYPLSVYEVGDLVGQVLITGYYTHPSTGQVLDAQQVVEFLTNTFDAG